MKAEHIGLLILFGVLLLTALPTMLSGNIAENPDLIAVAGFSITLIVWAYIVRYKRERGDLDDK